MAGRWLTSDGVNMPQWLVTLIVAGMVGLAGLTYWDGRNNGIISQQIKGLAEQVRELAAADKLAHAQMQQNSRDISEINGRLSMTAAGRALITTAPGRSTGGKQ